MINDPEVGTLKLSVSGSLELGLMLSPVNDMRKFQEGLIQPNFMTGHLERARLSRIDGPPHKKKVVLWLQAM